MADTWTLEIHYRPPASTSLAQHPIYRDRGPTVRLNLDAAEVQSAIQAALADNTTGGVVIYRPPVTGKRGIGHATQPRRD